jgi:uncharacterized membrane protein
MNSDTSDNLESQVSELRWRVHRLEETLARHGIVAGQAPPVPALKEKIAVAAPPAAAAPPPPPAFAPAPAPIAPPQFLYAKADEAKPSPSLESRIGSQWFNRIGILAVLIAVAWFLKLAFDNHWIGPLGRVLIGLLAGAGLIAWSARFRKRGYVAFAYSLQAIGSGTLYLSLWAAFQVYDLMPAAAAFAAMIAVTAFNGFMAWIQDAELLALYAIAGGLSTPLLVSTGGNHEITLFSYLLLLDAAVLILVALRPWSRLLAVAFAGTAPFVAAWWFEFYSQQQAPRTAVFLAGFFLLFAFAPRLVRTRLDEQGGIRFWDVLALIVLPVLNAALGFLAFYCLLDPSATDWAGPWIAVAFAAFYLLLVKLPARGVLRESTATVSALHLAAAIVFFTIAIPLKTQGRWLTTGWLAEGAALLWTARRAKSILLLVFALVCLAMGIVALLTVNPSASLTPFFNERFATDLFAIAVCAFVARLARGAGEDEDGMAGFNWPTLAAIAVLTVNALILFAVGCEIHSYWWMRRWSGDVNRYNDFSIYAQFTYSAFFMLFGAALMGVGFWRRSAFLRWQAMVLLAATVLKVFLGDTSQLSTGFRVLSFLALGVLLLMVSFAYQRDWLKLRGEGDHGQ